MKRSLFILVSLGWVMTLPVQSLEIPAPKFKFRDIDFLGTWKIRGTVSGTYLEGMWIVNPDGTGSMVYIATIREKGNEVKREDGQSDFNWKVDRDGYLIIHFKPPSSLREEILRRPCFFVPMEVNRGGDDSKSSSPELVFRQLLESSDGDADPLGEELKIRQTGNPFRVLP